MAEPHTRVTILLGLCLVCTYGTPVADMLTHSPPLPLVIDFDSGDITAEDEEAIILAIAQRDRVRRIRLNIPGLKLQRLIMAIDGEYPILEYLILGNNIKKTRTTVSILPETLQTPHLRFLAINCSIPIRFQLLTTAVGLVTLNLSLHHPSTYFQPTVLLQLLSLMPQLEDLVIILAFALTNLDVERQLMRTPSRLMSRFPTFAHLNSKLFALTKKRFLREQLMFSLVQFMGRIENLRFNRARFHFDIDGRTRVYVHWFVNLPETDMPTSDLAIIVNRRHLDWQISSVAQIFNALRQIFSAVEHLTLTYRVLDRSSEGHDEVERTEWRKLLRSFSNVKTLRVDSGLVIAISRCLRLDDGEHPLNVLPELEELIYYSWSGNADDAFSSFVDARQMAGCISSILGRGPAYAIQRVVCSLPAVSHIPASFQLPSSSRLRPSL
ncbi:hypothetical protein BGY98DRAFT_1100696 [Russula aff. rugulosa BPL654]|nr:hypothetical protein BGY98DRAFT_1100696 [Russula aff. rugulosa BPL654]